MVQKRAILAAGVALLVLVLIGGGWWLLRPSRTDFVNGQRELTPAEREALTAAVESSLQGPSARFVWYPLREKTDGVYCAQINIAAGGDTTGEQRLFEVVFAPSSSGGIKTVTSVYMPGNDESWRRIIRDNCAKAGYVAPVARSLDAG